MVKKRIKYRLILIIVILLFSTLFIESPYHGDYYDEPPFLFYFLITLANMLIYLFPTYKFIFIEKLIYSSIISFVVLLFGGIILEKMLGFIYGYDSNWDELKSPELLDNFLFFFITNFMGIGMFAICLKYKKPTYKMNTENKIHENTK